MDNTDVTFIFQILIIYQEVEDELPKNTNRDTLFHMEGLTGAERSTSPTEPDDHVTKEPPPLLDRSVLKKNAPKRKRTLSTPRRVGNRPGVQMEYKG